MKPARSLCLWGLCLVLLVGCQKENALPGDQELEVYATTINTVDGAGTVEPLSGKDVFIAKDGEQNGFLFSAKTDVNGFVLFKGLIGNESYRVFAQDVVGGSGTVVSADSTVRGDVGSLHLPLTPGGNGQNGFVVTMTNLAHEPRAGLPVRVYATLALAQQDQSAASLLNGTTDAFGRVYKLGIAAATYYARARNSAAGIDTIFTIPVQADGIRFLSTPVSASFPAPTGLYLRCTDASDTGIPGLSVLGFATQPLAVVADSLTSSFICPSSGYGAYTATGMEGGTYYLSIRNAANLIDMVLPVTIIEGTIDSVEVVVM